MSGSVGTMRHAGTVTVEKVTSARQRSQFLKLPWTIYADDPHWIPPLLVEERRFLDRKRHPFYLHGEASLFLALRDGRPVGRVLVSDDPRYNQQHDDSVGCFGMFESIDDADVAHALLDRAADWVRARGRTRIMGPIDYSTNYRCGLLVEGFDTPPRVMMNHHPPYYAELLESWGLDKARDLYSWWFAYPQPIVKRWEGLVERIARRGRVTVRPFRVRDFEEEVQRCRAIYNETLESNWGSVKMTDAEFRYLAAQLKSFAVPEMLLFAETEGRPVGFSVTVPNLNEAIQSLNGRLTWFGLPINFFRLLRNLKRIRTARLMMLGVLAGYRRRGVAELLILRTIQEGVGGQHYTGAELGWTLEENHLINRTIEAVGAQRYKTYRIYQRTLD